MIYQASGYCMNICGYCAYGKVGTAREYVDTPGDKVETAR